MSAPFLSLAVRLDGAAFRCAVLSSEYGEIARFDSEEALAARLRKWRGLVLSHQGAARDFAILGILQNVRLVGAGVGSALLGTARLACSSKLFPMTLADLGRAVALEALPEETSSREAFLACEREAEIGVRALVEHREALRSLGLSGRRWPLTPGGTAKAVLGMLEPEHVAALNESPLQPEEWREQQAAVNGDRSEIFWVGTRPEVYVYDLSSSYPATWLEGPTPIGPWRHVSWETGAPGVHECEVRQSRRALPVVATDSAWKYDGTAWLTTEEIAEVRALGGWVKAGAGWVSERVAPIGQKTVRHLYPLKRQRRPWAKGALVALHGKFVQGLTGSTFVREGNSYVQDKTLTPPDWCQRPLVGGWVYARARLRLGRTMQALIDRGWSIFYAKADSIHTDCPPKWFPEPLGIECGDWKLEQDQCEGVYAGMGLYALRRGGRVVKVASAGTPVAAVTWEMIEQVAAGRRVRVEHSGGLVPWRGAVQIGRREVATVRKVLCMSTVGKRGRSGRLEYIDA